jgi:erythronate-4-phosphate dehydrogenase
MKIVADENILYVKEAFGTLGDVQLVSGRTIAPAHVHDADILLVRSVTTVDERLLRESAVRFVGSASIGVDHVDEAYLRARGLGFAFAPGSNANSVAEYVVAALVALGPERYRDRTLGIIGLGHIGTLVREKALALGMTVLANDPPLERAGRTGLVSLETILRRSDLVTCHVPLTKDGEDVTHHLIDESALALLQRHAIVVNTSRGAVVDNAALLRALRDSRLGGAVLDVWEGEPEPDPDLIRAATLGTPHIAGYSFDGKVAGTTMLYQAACEYFKRPGGWISPITSSFGKPSAVEVDAGASLHAVLSGLVPRAYDIRQDDAGLRALVQVSGAQRRAGFDRLRATYSRRLEFRNTRVVVPVRREDLRGALQKLGFSMVSERNEFR